MRFFTGLVRLTLHRTHTRSIDGPGSFWATAPAGRRRFHWEQVNGNEEGEAASRGRITAEPLGRRDRPHRRVALLETAIKHGSNLGVDECVVVHDLVSRARKSAATLEEPKFVHAIEGAEQILWTATSNDQGNDSRCRACRWPLCGFVRDALDVAEEIVGRHEFRRLRQRAVRHHRPSRGRVHHG